MAEHVAHPDLLRHGLADDCRRCAAIAADPFGGLDETNLRLLLTRTAAWMVDQEFPRSAAEARAMRNIEKFLRVYPAIRTFLEETV